MAQLELVITLTDGQTLHAQPRPEDERRLAELLGERTTIAFAANEADLEGHAMSNDVAIDVEGHAMVLRLPQAPDAAALRRALAAGAITATIVGAGFITGLQLESQPPTAIVPAPAIEQVITVPAQAQRAEQAEMAREQSFSGSQVAHVASNPAVPAQALRAEQAEMARERAYEAMTAEQAGQAAQAANQGVQVDVNNPAVPAQALRADQAEAAREQSFHESQVPLDADNQ